MNELDRRAAEAAAALRGDVAEDLDVDAAYDTVLAGGRPRRTRAALGRGVLVAAAVVAVLVGTVAIVSQVPSGTARTDDLSASGDEELSAAGAAILGGLPDGPLDGRESWRLPVVAAPQDGLHDGDQVTLYGRGFVPGELVGAVHCSAEADTSSAGVGACELGTTAGSFDRTETTSARSDGTVVVTVTLRQHITTPNGQVDCGSAAERCLLAIGAADDYDRSGGTYVNFADAPPFPTPSMVVEPGGPHRPGQELGVIVSGLIPGRPGQILQCAGDEHCASLSQGRVGDDGTFGATVAVGSTVVVEGEERACDGDCTLRFTGIGVPGASSAPLPEPYPLELLPGDATVGAAPPETGPPATSELLPPVEPPDTTTSEVAPPTSGAVSPTTTSEPPTTVVPSTTTAPADPDPTTTTTTP